MDVYTFIFKRIYKLPGWLIIKLIHGYRILISPFLGTCCRFYPSCSQYAIEAIKVHGIFTGFWFVSKRLIKCHPGFPGGHDPIPKKKAYFDEIKLH